MTILLAVVLAATVSDVSRLTSVKGVSIPAKVETRQLAGEWYRGDGLGYNLTLTVGEDGRYRATWNGCVGEYGRAAGTWSQRNGHVSLSPTEETEMMVNHLRELTVVTYRGKLLLVPSGRDGNFFVEHGPSDYSCFHREADLPHWWEDSRDEPR